MRLQSLVCVCLLGLFLAACSILPQTPKQSVAAGYVTIESLADAAAVAYRDGHIDAQQRTAIRESLRTAMGHLEQAESLIVQGLPSDAPLHRAQAVLQVVQSILAEHVNE